jgi:hypothetical protein
LNLIEKQFHKKRKKVSQFNKGGIARGCGAVREKKRKTNKIILMAKKGLRAWVKEKWVDIGAPKKDGKYQPCGRKKGSKRKYPKCVPLAKATRMTKSQKASAVKRKRAAGNPGGKPTNVKTFASGWLYLNFQKSWCSCKRF